jgi:two-component system invasion response regulator UvrY
MEKITILIADDHKLVRDAWSFTLNSNPRFTVIGSASSGEEAVELAETLRPMIVLMDINMGEMSGFDATQIIRNRMPDMKVIGVSMHTMPAYVKKLLKMGGSGFVTKNSNKEELFEAIIQVCQGKTYICEEVKQIVAKQEFETDGHKPDISILSKRELEVVQHIRNGLSSREISGRLGVSLRTIEVHRYKILKKLTLPNAAALVNFVNHQGF